MAGKGAHILYYDWLKWKDAIDDTVLVKLELDDVVDGSDCVGIVMSANLKFLGGLPRRRLLLWGGRSSSFGKRSFFENAYSRLVVVARVKSAALSLLAAVFSVSEPEA